VKSYITLFSELYRSLARDFTSQYPSIEREIERDLGRLQSSFRTEGLGFVTLTHPAMNDFFQKSLAIGAFADSPTMTRPRGMGRKSVDDHRPRYLWCLFSMIFEEDGTLKSDPDVNAIAFVRQWLLMAKKVEIDCSEERKEASLTDFLAVDASLPDHHRDTWDLMILYGVVEKGIPSGDAVQLIRILIYLVKMQTMELNQSSGSHTETYVTASDL